nr:esterase [Manduca sexta]
MNKTVLVHGGTGALGQAAIAIALAHGCEVFATVGDLKKAHFLRKLYPALKEDHIGNSRDSSFGDMVLYATKGRGCDIIISSVDAELKDISLKCAGFNGVTFDTVQVLNQESYQYGMFHMTKQRSYIALDFSSIFDTQNYAERKILQQLICEGIARGYVRPLSRVSYAPHAAPRALRLLAASAHRGRVLLHLRDTRLHVLPRITCSSHHCNVIICDGSALSVHLANRLIQRGAKKLYIHLLNGATFSKITLRSWKDLGAHVEVSSGKLNDKEAVLKLLARANNLGHVEGIFVVATDRIEDITNKDLTSLAINIEVASKSICPVVNHCAVLAVGRNDPTIGLSAAKYLPTTFLSLSVQKTDDQDTQLGSWCQSVIDTLEEAIHAKHNVLIAQQRQPKQTTLKQDLTSIFGKNIFEENADDMSITDMRLHEAEVKKLSKYLLHKHNASISEKELLRLNKQNIKELVNILEERYYDEVDGIGKFFPRVEEDELAASAETMFLPTRARPVVTNSDDFEGFNSYVCIIPGLEGLGTKFKIICERLKIPALVLQPGLDRPYETISDTAERFAKILLEKIGVKNNFYLIGYEAGTLIAFEMAAILEKYGFEGTIYCVGCAPYQVKSVIEKEIKKYETEIEFQDAVIRHMYSLMTDANITTLDKALREKSSWDDKLKACVRLLTGHIKYSTQYARAVIESAYGRLVEAFCYNFTAQPLKSRIILLQSPNIPSDFDDELLQLAAVHKLQAPLSSAPNDMRCSSIINKYLSPDILEEFENKNWCEMYME